VSKEHKTPPIDVRRTVPSMPRREAPVMNNITGRVMHDERGNAVWQFARPADAPPADAQPAGSRPVSKPGAKLDNPTLSLMEDRRPADEIVKKNPLGTVKGYSPYDSGVLEKKDAPRKKDLRKLSEWMRLKRQHEKLKAGDE